MPTWKPKPRPWRHYGSGWPHKSFPTATPLLFSILLRRVIIVNEWLTLLQGALAGGALGAFVSPVISQRSDRRTARAKAREKLAEAENARRNAGAAFCEILIQLRTAAMIASAPQPLVEKYISVAQNFRKYGFDENTGSSARLDRSKPQNWSGFLNMDAVMAASVLSQVLWHPWARRVLAGTRLRLKLWIWRRRTMWIVTRGTILDVHETGELPSDDGVALFCYCDGRLPRRLRRWGSGVPFRLRPRQLFRVGSSDKRSTHTA
jgi:hypothetical protein